MAVTFALRGNSTDARRALGNNVGTKVNSSIISVVSTGSGFDQSYIDLSNSGVVKLISYSGYLNTPNGRNMSVAFRFAPTYSGAPAGRRALWSMSVGVGTSAAYLEMFHEATNGNLYVIGKNESGAVTFATVSFGAWTTGVANAEYDFVFTWDGTNTASAAKLYKDASLFGSATATNSLSATWDNTMWKNISVGACVNAAASANRLYEFVIDDTIIDPTSVTLESGTGSLNGASRTSFMAATAFVGNSYSDPGVANVKSGTAYTYNGTSLTGTYQADYADISTIKSDVKLIKAKILL